MKKNKTIILCAVYFLPRCSLVEYENHSINVEKCKQSEKVTYIITNYNLTELQGIDKHNNSKIKNSAASDNIVSKMLLGNYSPINDNNMTMGPY